MLFFAVNCLNSRPGLYTYGVTSICGVIGFAWGLDLWQFHWFHCTRQAKPRSSSVLKYLADVFNPGLQTVNLVQFTVPTWGSRGLLHYKLILLILLVAFICIIYVYIVIKALFICWNSRLNKVCWMVERRSCHHYFPNQHVVHTVLTGQTLGEHGRRSLVPYTRRVKISVYWCAVSVDISRWLCISFWATIATLLVVF